MCFISFLYRLTFVCIFVVFLFTMSHVSADVLNTIGASQILIDNDDIIVIAASKPWASCLI